MRVNVKKIKNVERDPFYAGKLLLPLDCPCPFGVDLNSYWAIRKDLFSRFDDGVRVDREGLFSLKPENAALDIARRLSGVTVLDAYCGVGGVAIALARVGKRVIAVDSSIEKVEMARINAAVYGVEDRIRFEIGDAADYVTQPGVDAIYFDPPWGSSRYIEKNWFRFKDFRKEDWAIVRQGLSRPVNVGLTLPMNFDFRELGMLARDFFVRWFNYRGYDLFSTVFFPAIS
jgi:trimethylguanosine synthase